jgi:hypothetical protein
MGLYNLKPKGGVVPTATRKFGTGTIHRRGEGFAIEGEYDIAFAEAVRVWPRPRPAWDNESKTWLVGASFSEVLELIKFTQKFAYRWGDEARELADGVLKRAEATRTASALPEAHFQVSGMRMDLRPYQAASVAFAMRLAGHEVGGDVVDPVKLPEKKTIGVLIGDETGLGKCHRTNTNVLTSSGWRTIGSLKVGDNVIGSNGKPANVLAIFPQGTKPSYRVKFSDGSSVEAGPDHLWTMRYHCGGRRWKEIVLTTEQMRTRPILEMKWKSGTRKSTKLDLSKTQLHLPMLKKPVIFNKQRGNLPIPPYFLGQLIANGHLASGTPQLSTAKWNWSFIKTRLKKEGIVASSENKYDNVIRAGFSGIINAIRSLDLDVLSREKHIPIAYLRATPNDRIALLHGLMDGDGSISKTGNKINYHTISARLAGNVQELVEGLGGVASVRAYDRSHESKPTDYQVRIRLPAEIPPFTLPRRASRYSPGRSAAPRRVVQSIEYVEDAESVCIAVDAPDALYATEHCILTHNTQQGMAIPHALGAWPAIFVVRGNGKQHWKRHIMGYDPLGMKAWLPGRSVVVVEGKGTIPTGADCYLVSYNLLHKHIDALRALKPRAVVFDEIHSVRNRNTLRAEAALALSQDVPLRVGLTANPVVNTAEDLVVPLTVLGWINEFGGPTQFRFTYGRQRQDRLGGKGVRDLKGLHMRLRSTCMVRRTKEEVFGELPPLQRNVIPLPLTNEAEYRAAEEDIVQWLVAHGKDPSGAMRAEKLVRLNKLRHLTEIGKVAGVIEWLNDNFPPSSDQKIVVWAHHEDAMSKLVEAFPDSAIVRGGMGAAAQKNVDRFQVDPSCRKLIGSLLAGGEQYTMTAASHMATLSLWWTPTAHFIQAEGRCYARQNDPHGLTSWYFLGEGSIDEHIWGVLVEKQKESAAVHDGADGEIEANIMDAVAERLMGGA